MKILIVGGRSVVGKALKPVISKNNEIITAGRSNCDIYMDLTDPLEKIIIPENIDCIIHTAACFGVETDSEIYETESVNVLGSLKLCQAAAKANIKHFIFISSIFSELTQSSQFYNIYSISKKHSEEIINFYLKSKKVPVTILKPSQIYGNENHFRKHQPFIYNLIDKIESGEPIGIFGSNDPIRNFIHINDLTVIILKVIQKKVLGEYSCLQLRNNTFTEIAKAAFKAFNKDIRIDFLPDKNDIPDNGFKIDNKLYDLIDYYPQISILEGIRKIANYRKSIRK